MVTISTWGNPANWKKIKYVCDETVTKYLGKEFCKPHVESKSTITLFNDKKVIILPITLAGEKSSDLVGEVINIVRKYLSANIPDDSTLKAFEEAWKLVVPGRGNFSYNKELRTFYSPTSTILASIILKVYPHIEKKVLLDITHGMNFYPVSVRGVVEKLVKIASMNHPSTLLIGSSDPFVGTPSELYFRILEKKAFETSLIDLPKIIEDKIKGKNIVLINNTVKGKISDDKKLKELNAKIKEINSMWYSVMNEIDKTIKSFKVPSPLYWSYILANTLYDIDTSRTVLSLIEKLRHLIDESYVISGNAVYQMISFKDIEDIEKLYAMIAYLKLIELAEDVLRNVEFELTEDVFLIGWDDLLSARLESHLTDAASKSIWEEEKMKIGTDAIEELKNGNFNSRMARRTVDAMLQCGNAIKELLKGIASEPKAKKNKYKLENVEEEVIRESLEALKSILDRDLIPYSFLMSKNLYEAIFWWIVEYSRTVAVKKVKDRDEQYLRHFLAHGGAEKNTTLFKVEKRGDEEKIFIGYYRPLVDSITEQLK